MAGAEAAVGPARRTIPVVHPGDRAPDQVPPHRASAELPLDEALALLSEGDMTIEGQLVHGSNHTFLARIEEQGHQALAVYKPRRGERPLWDFPGGTLCQRELAAWIVSEAIGWTLVPPTTLRDGELGPGMAQLWIPHDLDDHFLTMTDMDELTIARIAAFDVIINNADRKSGHVLRSADGRTWTIDHGVAFHVEPKLRTVIWDIAGQPLPRSVRDDLTAFADQLATASDLRQRLGELLTDEEVSALEERTRALVNANRFPEPDYDGRHIPWPPV